MRRQTLAIGLIILAIGLILIIIGVITSSNVPVRVYILFFAGIIITISELLKERIINTNNEEKNK